MGLYDRDYTQQDYRPSYRYSNRLPFQLKTPRTVVGWLLVINIAVFLISIIIKPVGVFIYDWFAIDTTSIPQMLQVWRLISYQFLHDPVSIFHILFNMYALYLFGRIVEQFFGSKRFLVFYFICGSVGGLFYIFLSLIGFLGKGMMVGASGSIFGILGACAVLFPQLKIILFPIPFQLSIRKVAIGAAVVFSFLIIIRSQNAGGEAAHLAGLAAGVVYTAWPTIKYKLGIRSSRVKIHKPQQTNREILCEVDRILQKVHDTGIHSLTRKEKRILKKATEIQQKLKI